MEFGTLGMIVGATLSVSLLSLVGIALFPLGKKKLDKVLFYMVSFSIGTLLAAALFDMIPESIEIIQAGAALKMAFVGIILAFVIEKFIHWHHHHAATADEHQHPAGTLTIIGDAIHNFFDGIAIAAAFMLGPELGIAATIAIGLHEIPQEIGDFGLLLYSGYSRSKALLFNLLSAAAAVAGGLLFYFFSGSFEHIEAYAIALSAGMFIYLAAADLMPELHKEKKPFASMAQLALILLGAGVMLAVGGMAHGSG